MNMADPENYHRNDNYKFEIWRDIPNYEGIYQISSFGRIKSVARKVQRGKSFTITNDKIKVPSRHNRGYLKDDLYKGGKKKTYFRHRLVAEIFLENPLNKKEVNHLNGIKDNNFIAYLEWTTREENNSHSIMTGLTKNQDGENNRMAKYTWNQINQMRKMKTSGISNKDIAIYFNINKGTLGDILSFKTWKI